MFLDVTFFYYYKLKRLRKKNIKQLLKVYFSISDGEKLGAGLNNWNAFTSCENQNEKKTNLIEWNKVTFNCAMSKTSSDSAPFKFPLLPKFFQESNLEQKNL